MGECSSGGGGREFVIATSHLHSGRTKAPCEMTLEILTWEICSGNPAGDEMTGGSVCLAPAHELRRYF